MLLRRSSPEFVGVKSIKELTIINGFSFVRRPNMVTYHRYSIYSRSIANGIMGRVLLPHEAATCMYCNGVENVGFHGVITLVLMPQEAATCMYCNGVAKIEVHGMYIRVLVQQKMAICMYCNGVEKMVAHGINLRALMQQ